MISEAQVRGLNFETMSPDNRLAREEQLPREGGENNPAEWSQAFS